MSQSRATNFQTNGPVHRERHDRRARSTPRWNAARDGQRESLHSTVCFTGCFFDNEDNVKVHNNAAQPFSHLPCQRRHNRSIGLFRVQQKPCIHPLRNRKAPWEQKPVVSCSSMEWSVFGCFFFFLSIANGRKTCI